MIRPRVKRHFNRPMCGKPSVQGLHTGLHVTHRPIEQKVVNSADPSRGETSITTFSYLSSRKMLTQPNGHFITGNVEIASNDKAEASSTKLGHKFLKSLMSHNRFFGMTIEANDNELTQAMVFNLDRHGPMAGNNLAGAGNSDVMRPDETNTASGAPTVARVQGGVKTALISLGQSICPSDVNASLGGQMMLLNANEFKSFVRLFKPFQGGAPSSDIGSDDPKRAFSGIPTMRDPFHDNRQLPAPRNHTVCAVRNRNAPPVSARRMPILSKIAAHRGVTTTNVTNAFGSLSARPNGLASVKANATSPNHNTIEHVAYVVKCMHECVAEKANADDSGAPTDAFTVAEGLSITNFERRKTHFAGVLQGSFPVAAHSSDFSLFHQSPLP